MYDHDLLNNIYEESSIQLQNSADTSDSKQKQLEEGSQFNTNQKIYFNPIISHINQKNEKKIPEIIPILNNWLHYEEESQQLSYSNYLQ